jgi:hypothetical protein
MTPVVQRILESSVCVRRVVFRVESSPSSPRVEPIRRHQYTRDEQMT